MEYVEADATISPCGVYRYQLKRTWVQPHLWSGSRGWCLFVMLNPSTADGKQDDPTIRRCVGFARRWGFGGLLVANLFAFRATNPRELYRVDDPVGPENDARIVAQANAASLVVCGWGTNVLKERDRAVLDLLRGIGGHKTKHLGLTVNGYPRHPLYLKADTDPQDFPS